MDGGVEESSNAFRRGDVRNRRQDEPLGHRLVIIGAGGFGREVHDVVEAVNAAAASVGRAEPWAFLGFIDDGQPDDELLSRRGTMRLGDMTALRAVAAEGTNAAEPLHYVVAIADPQVRRALSQEADQAGLEPAILVHPTATFGADTHLGPGTVVCSHVSLTTNVQVGRHCHINLNVTVGHDSGLADFATVHPSASLGGGVELGEDVTIGSGATVLPRTEIGHGTYVGAGAVVLSDLPPGVVAVGVPAVVR